MYDKLIKACVKRELWRMLKKGNGDAFNKKKRGWGRGKGSAVVYKLIWQAVLIWEYEPRYREALNSFFLNSMWTLLKKKMPAMAAFLTGRGNPNTFNFNRMYINRIETSFIWVPTFSCKSDYCNQLYLPRYKNYHKLPNANYPQSCVAVYSQIRTAFDTHRCYIHIN